MDPGEQITGTRDEQYNLISVLYHALQGAETVEAYVLDAEAAGDERLIAYFTEAQATYVELADRAKELLGIPLTETLPEDAMGGVVPPEGIAGGMPNPATGGAIPPEGITGGMPPQEADVQREPDVLAEEVDVFVEEGPGIPAAGAAGVAPEPGTMPVEVPGGEPAMPETTAADLVEDAEAGTGAGEMQEYQQGQFVAASQEEVFAWLSDVENLPKYLPPIKEASIEGPSAEGAPGQRLWLRGEIPGRGEFENEGYFAVYEAQRRIEWGAEVYRDYAGWLTVAEAGEGRSEVVVNLSFGERSVEPEIQEESGPDRDPLEESLSATLESIRRQIEEGAEKLPTPPPDD